MATVTIKNYLYKGDNLNFEIVEKLPKIGDLVEPKVWGEKELVKVTNIVYFETYSDYMCYFIYKSNRHCEAVALKVREDN